MEERLSPDPGEQRKAYYLGMQAALEDLYDASALKTLADDKTPGVSWKTFQKAVKSIWKNQGYNPDMLAEPQAEQLIRQTHAAYRKAVSAGIADNVIPPAMANRLDHDSFRFSGFKAHHQLSEVGLALRDAQGRIKSYDAFEREVLAVHDRYNRQYLRAEYDYAISSAQMAAKWADAAQSGHSLQYRTANDNRVREEHAALHGTTLPAADPFWREYYPPNGWRCRCTAVEVNQGKYPESDSKESIERGRQATTKLDRYGNNKGAIFRFNPGLEEKVFPPKHPYLPKGCEGCQYDNLAYRKDNTNCQACRKIDGLYNQVERVDVRKAMENLKGISKSQHKEQLIAISQMKIYNPVSGEKAVFSAISEKNPDYKPLVEVARKLVKKEGCAYLLPNPKTLRTGDILFVNGSTYRLYEVKTIHGKNSVDNRLLSSIGQADMVILNITTKQKKVGLLGSIIQGYFENNENVREMRVFDGAKPLPPYKRDQVVGNDQFVARFRRDYNR